MGGGGGGRSVICLSRALPTFRQGEEGAGRESEMPAHAGAHAGAYAGLDEFSVAPLVAPLARTNTSAAVPATEFSVVPLPQAWPPRRPAGGSEPAAAPATEFAVAPLTLASAGKKKKSIAPLTLADCYIFVLMLPYVCPHTAVYVSSCCYICVLMLLYMCPTAPLTLACAGPSEPVDGGVCASQACDSVSRASFGPRSSAPPLSPDSDNPHRPLLYPYAGAQSRNPLLLHAPLCWLSLCFLSGSLTA